MEKKKRLLSLKNDEIYRSLLTLGGPIVLQNLLSAAVSSADVVMLNFVGQSSLSAVSLASNYNNILHLVYYGLSTGAALLAAQYYGKKDYRAIEAVEGIAHRFSILISALIALCTLLIPELLMKVYTNDAELIELGCGYLKWVGISYLCMGVTEVYLSVLRSVNRVKICTALNTLAFSLNILLNAVFIFGLFGAPKMGAAGVGLATAISRFVELIACILVSVKSKDVHISIPDILHINKTLFKDFLKLALPALINDVLWSVAFSLYSSILGHLDSDAVAANSITLVLRNFGTMFCFAFASAGGILIGNLIGAGDKEKAEEASKKLMVLTVIAGLLGGLIILAATPFILKFAEVSDQARQYLKTMLLINSYYVMGAAVNTSLICGIFRAGGDTKFGMICDGIDMWCYAVPLGYLAAFVLKLPVMWVYFLLCTDEFVKWPWVIGHYKKGKWLNDITREKY